MRNKTAVIGFIFCVLFIPFLVSPAYALFDSDVDKAKDFMTAGMYPQAIELLNKRINEKPTDDEAHYHLGVCYLNTGNYSRAEERFSSAIRFDSNYGDQIGDEYKKAALNAMDKGNDSNAVTLFKQAIKNKANLKAGIISHLFIEGKKQPDRYFSLVLNIDSTQKTKVADYYKSLSDKASDEEQKVTSLKKAAEIDSSRYSAETQALGRKYLALAKENAGWIDKMELSAKQERLARELLGDDVVEEAFPVKVYKPGDYPAVGEFKYEANRISPNWQLIPNESIFEFVGSKWNFDLYLHDGSVIKVRKKSDLPKELKQKFKVAAPFEPIAWVIRVYDYSRRKKLELKNK